MADNKKSMTDEDALVFHAQGRPGKLEISATKPLTTQRDLSLAYSPGVAIPCLRIEEDPSTAYDYTAKGNVVAVISNGTAVLGLGSIGALASKPVMEGKAVLFKRFADVDGIDLEVDTTDVDEFVNAVRYLGPSFGGINLEDIKAPECFIIEQRLRELMDIPVFHDDQHGTAIIAAAGLLNALDLTNRDIKTTKLVCNGAGAAAIACVELVKALGMPSENVIMCDSKGVIYQGREEGMNQWKSAHAVATKDRTLQEALKGADVFFGLSVKGAVTGKMVKEMADQPIIFAMANPDPEITPDEVKAVRKDAIIATGRSDFANQVNNVLGFPYIFRGALDVRASTINDEMKTAAARAIAELAREDVPDEVAAAYGGTKLVYGPDYIIPAPFDPRLIVAVPGAVAQAAMDSGVAAKPIIDMERYRQELKQRLDPTAGMLNLIFSKVRSNPRRVTFAEGEEERVIRAAVAFRNAGYGYPVLIGREDRIVKKMEELGLDGGDIEIQNAKLSHRNEKYAEFLYKRLQRKGFMYRDCLHQVNQDRNVFASCMLALNETDAVVTGITRHFHDSFDAVQRVIDTKKGEVPMGLMIIVSRGRTYFVADTSIHDTPDAETLADISEQTATFAQSLGLEPRVAFMSASSFGNPSIVKSNRISEAVQILNDRRVSFEFDGEMSPSVALNSEQRERLYPFCKLSGDANILVMPGLHSAHIATRLLQEIGKCTVIGPLVMGMSKPVQIVQTGASVNDIVNAAALAVHDALR
ncbi:NADP-dependent malic enzyme [Curvivirga aplysinae]|uniref:NADP-dependent malic enzyme n=1 Tax=Curvivirga aplysinae TaxID=2529852 RepID=UPI0012BC8DCE|nr:NADP-dependent malic enzyme [Curvivirga aplysinae]MTI10294.1 NADP-dependent malic enzyme [Curvivirga aplysinae]